MNRLGAMLAAMLLLLLGCQATPSAPDELTVFGAASLRVALDSLADAWHSEHANSTWIVSTGSSAALRTQIEQGAPADVFLSADTSNPQALADAGLTDGPSVTFATNSLVVIVPPGNPAGIQSPADLSRSGLCVVGAGQDVPINRYAEEVVDNLATLPEYGPQFAAGYAVNVCSREDNVAAVVTKVQLGEGDAAIVYASDARAAPDVGVIQIPGAANVVATYAGVAAAGGHAAEAHVLLDWLLGDTAQSIIVETGFGRAP